MREYKFRGQDIETREWYYGGILQYKDCMSIIDVHIPRRNQEVAVIPETIGQYTGIKDITDKEIYENDLVVITNYNWEGSYLVVWDNKESMFKIQDINGDCEAFYEFEYRVIGNKHDNIEFMEALDD